MSELLVITGMSGAGRSTAGAVLEDLGWAVIDNLPARLIPEVGDLAPQVALVVGRDVSDMAALDDGLAALRRTGHRVRSVFLDAADEVLVRRFEGTRRRHPVAGAHLIESIERERELLAPARRDADLVVDTSSLSPHALKERLAALFELDGSGPRMQTTVVSFAYSQGIPLDVDLLFDCRFVPNPHWVDELRPLTGLDAPVRDYVLSQPEAGAFLGRVGQLLELLLPAYVKEGKSYLTVAVGCTGGRHRSVVMAEEIAAMIRDQGVQPSLVHRDLPA